MKALRVRDIPDEERQVIEQGRRSASAFTVRLCPILLMSAEEGLKPHEIGERLRAAIYVYAMRCGLLSAKEPKA